MMDGILDCSIYRDLANVDEKFEIDVMRSTQGGE